MRKMIMAVLAFSFLLASCQKESNGTGGTPPPTPPPPTPPPATQKDIAEVDNAVTSFMTTYAIPGVSIAIMKNEKLVYLKSYGKMSASDNTPITNESLFRIASVSKPVTAVGIMKLLEANKLTLDSKVFGTGSILGNDYPSTKLNTVADITVRQLLHHTTNAWPNNGTDPMFLQPTYNFGQLISWTLDTYNANTTRGIYNYSNFGYCILGRVIEKLSSKSYEQYIKDEVLTPCGITTMQMGGNTLADRKSKEVIYNGQGGQNPYLYNIARMDAHGGWIASAKDLAKFIVRVDGYTTKADILSATTINTMITRSVPSSNYACGWGVNSANHWWHLGSLPGTMSQIVRANNGFSWVILCNSRSNNANFSTAIDGLLWPAATSTTIQWQDIDQF